MLSLSGTIVSGKGVGQQFLQLPGYRKRIRELAGFEPFPGTLNIQANPAEWKRIQQQAPKKKVGDFVENEVLRGGFYLYKIRLLDDTQAAAIVPHQTTHPPEIVEIVAPQNLRQAHGLKDGQNVTIFFEEKI